MAASTTKPRVGFFGSSRSPAAQLYNALWYPALPVALFAMGGCDAAVRRQRLGHLDLGAQSLREDAPRVWVHAASVGEVEAARPVLAKLLHEDPRLQLVLTTMTTAGRDAARRRIGQLAACQLAPLDAASAVRRFLATLRPHLILIAETELWPNYFSEGLRSGARIAIFNGRLSPRSLQRYRLARSLFGRTLECVEKILVQTAADAERFGVLGAPVDRVTVTGNTKFDFDDASAPLRPALAAFAPGRPLLVAGSTAAGEERMVIETYRNLVARFPDLALAIAPRHLERAPEVEEDLRAEGLAYTKASAPQLDAGEANVLLLDTMGELRSFYFRATIAFVGGSMNPPRGGQSMAEPAAAAVPILFGPHYENQRQMGLALLAERAAVVVNDGAELATQCAAWLADDSLRRATGQAARRVIERLAGGATATVQHLLPMLPAT